MIRPDIPGGISSCCWLLVPLISAIVISLMEFFSSLGSLLKGSPMFLEWFLCDFEKCSWESFTYLLVLSSINKEGLTWKSYLISDPDLFWFCLYLLSCIGVDVKIEVNEKNKVILALSILVTYSPCHVVTLKSAASSMPWAWARW